MEKRAERAEALICLGEISARRALEASPVAPRTEATLPRVDRRWTETSPRDAILDVILETDPVHPFEMDKEMQGGSGRPIMHAQ